MSLPPSVLSCDSPSIPGSRTAHTDGAWVERAFSGSQSRPNLRDAMLRGFSKVGPTLTFVHSTAIQLDSIANLQA